MEPPLTKKARFASVDNTAMDQLDRDTTAKWLKIPKDYFNEKEIEYDFATITEVELGNVFDKCTWIFVKSVARCTREFIYLFIYLFDLHRPVASNRLF